MAQPFASYLFLFLVMLIRSWGRWVTADFSGGDVASSFYGAYQLLDSGELNWARNALYRLYLAGWLILQPDVVWVMYGHRLLIYFVSGWAWLWTARKLFSTEPLLALGLAVFWVANPLSLDALYEIHLFGLIVLLLVMRGLISDWPWGRALGLVALFPLCFFGRNEYAVFALVAVGLVLVVDRSATTWKKAAGLGVIGVIWILSGTALTGHSFWSVYQKKSQSQTQLQFGQGYAVYYKQVHPEWDKNPFLFYKEINQQTFGMENVGVAEAWRLNPSAVRDFVWHNWQQLPSGISLLLTGRTYRDVDPNGDQVERPFRGLQSVAYGTIGLTLGALGFWLRRRWLKLTWRYWLWASALPCAILVTALQRATPIYLMPLALFFYVVMGFWLQEGLVRWRRGATYLLLFLIVLNIGWAAAQNPLWKKRRAPLADMVVRVRPYREILAVSGAKLLCRNMGQATLEFLDLRRRDQSVEWPEAWSGPLEKTAWKTWLQTPGAEVCYLDESWMVHPDFARQLEQLPTNWRIDRQGFSPTAGPWYILRRVAISP